MPAEGVLIFDEPPTTSVVSGSFEHSFVVLDEAALLAEGEASEDLLLVDGGITRTVVDDLDPLSTDFIILDAESPTVASQLLAAPGDFLLVDPPQDETRVVLDGEPDTDLLVVTPGGPPGKPGPQGEEGPQGPKGLDGAGAYYQEFNFASPLTLWTIVHNQNTFGLAVETVDTNGEVVEGDVQRPDANTVTVEWFLPMAGVARLSR